MTRYEKVQLQREAVRLFSYVNFTYRVPEADIVKTFPLPTITRNRTVEIWSNMYGKKVVTIKDGFLTTPWSSPEEPGYFKSLTVEGMIDSGYITDPKDVLRVQALLANPTETIEDKS